MENDDLRMINIAPYNTSFKNQWDALVAQSRNGTFLHLRNYMDYHSDRFEDMSLVATKNDVPVALLPACREGRVLYSHRGLTYGGWITAPRHFDVTVMQELWNSAIEYLKSQGIKTIVYKPVPHIYHSVPAEEDLYALFTLGAKITACNISSTINLNSAMGFDRGNKRNVNLAMKNGLVVEESEQWEEYWNILSAVLREKYGKNPVHSLEEIKLLKSRFPANIKLFVATHDNKPVAGVVMYYCGSQVAHCQYIASSSQGRDLKALPLLFHHLIGDARNRGINYFDYGISTEQDGHKLNVGLAGQKSRLGGRGVVYNTYQLDI